MGRMSTPQNDVYLRRTENASTTHGLYGLSELPCDMYVCHNVGERWGTSVSGVFLLKKVFKDV